MRRARPVARAPGSTAARRWALQALLNLSGDDGVQVAIAQSGARTLFELHAHALRLSSGGGDDDDDDHDGEDPEALAAARAAWAADATNAWVLPLITSIIANLLNNTRNRTIFYKAMLRAATARTRVRTRHKLAEIDAATAGGGPGLVSAEVLRALGLAPKAAPRASRARPRADALAPAKLLFAPGGELAPKGDGAKAGAAPAGDDGAEQPDDGGVAEDAAFRGALLELERWRRDGFRRAAAANVEHVAVRGRGRGAAGGARPAMGRGGRAADGGAAGRRRRGAAGDDRAQLLLEPARSASRGSTGSGARR